MKKIISTKNFCTAAAILCIAYGIIAGVQNRVFYWHIFAIAALFYNLAAAEKKAGL